MKIGNSIVLWANGRGRQQEGCSQPNRNGKQSMIVKRTILQSICSRVSKPTKIVIFLNTCRWIRMKDGSIILSI